MHRALIRNMTSGSQTYDRLNCDQIRQCRVGEVLKAGSALDRFSAVCDQLVKRFLQLGKSSFLKLLPQVLPRSRILCQEAGRCDANEHLSGGSSSIIFSVATVVV